MSNTVLIAETHLEQAIFLKRYLEEFENINIIDEIPGSSKEMEDAIRKYKPQIVITNEQKNDYPATEAILKIQNENEGDITHFIILSAYPDVWVRCRNKGIRAEIVVKPYDKEKITETLNYIIN